ncbi:Ribosomal protein S6--L-glutamate ligase [anaerobic digester metagenome]
MILVCGIPSDGPTRLVIDAAEAAGVDHVVLNQRESRSIGLRIDVRRGRRIDGTLSLCGRDWPLSGFSGVFLRLMDWQDLPENRVGLAADPGGVRRSGLLHDALIQWTEMTGCRVMNRCSAMGSNASKPYQAQFIQAAGFLTPPTLITSDPGLVKKFLRTHGQVVFKSISGTRSIVQTLSDVKLLHLDRVRLLPTQFQAFVPGTNVRVHVTGREVFATEMRTEAVDYRYPSSEGEGVEMVPVQLPDEVEARCRTLAERLDLPLAGVDLKVTPTGEYFCFEVNPMPAYSFFQEGSGQEIAGGIVRYLVGGDAA